MDPGYISAIGEQLERKWDEIQGGEVLEYTGSVHLIRKSTAGGEVTVANLISRALTRTKGRPLAEGASRRVVRLSRRLICSNWWRLIACARAWKCTDGNYVSLSSKNSSHVRGSRARSLASSRGRHFDIDGSRKSHLPLKSGLKTTRASNRTLLDISSRSRARLCLFVRLSRRSRKFINTSVARMSHADDLSDPPDPRVDSGCRDP